MIFKKGSDPFSALKRGQTPFRVVRVVALGVGVWIAGSSAAVASPQAEMLDTVRHLAIQHQGRFKPIDSFARETLRQITGASRYGRMDPVETILAILTSPEAWQDEPLIAIPFVPLREALGLPVRTTHISYNEVIATRALMHRLPPLVEKQSRDESFTMLDNETWDAYERFVSLSGLFEQRLYLVPPPPGAIDRTWRPILSPDGYDSAHQEQFRSAWTAFVTAWRTGSPEAQAAAVQGLDATLHVANPDAYVPSWRLRWEVRYNRLAPFHWARILYGLGFLLLVASFRARGRVLATSGLAAVGAGLTLHSGGIALRVILGERPPVSNFFETMLWLPLVTVVLALVFERVYRVRYFALSGALLAAITLTLADYMPLNSSITPVVAVLRSNLWLTVHVLTIVASYGAIALATVLAHVYGVMFLNPHTSRENLQALDTYLYRAMQVGVVLLAAGTMLGAVWANASWGRYWGWDPKETWALITLLWYLAILHGRFAGWMGGIGTALATIVGFFLLLVTYYGVSFYFVGLHSYAGGNAKPLPPVLIGYLVAELVFLGGLGVAAFARRRVA